MEYVFSARTMRRCTKLSASLPSGGTPRAPVGTPGSHSQPSDKRSLAAHKFHTCSAAAAYSVIGIWELPMRWEPPLPLGLPLQLGLQILLSLMCLSSLYLLLLGPIAFFHTLCGLSMPLLEEGAVPTPGNIEGRLGTRDWSSLSVLAHFKGSEGTVGHIG